MASAIGQGVRRALDVLIVSDLHLALDPRRESGNAAADFLDLVLSMVHRRRPWRLLLLGDVLDVATAAAVRARDDDAERRAVDAIGRLLEAHPPLVEALRVAGSEGATISIATGNHDIEWSVPAVQALLRAAAGPTAEISFHPWILYLPGILYAEHGHQHHDVNALPRPLQPDHHAGGLHLGATLDEYLASIGRRRGEPPPVGIGALARTVVRHPGLLLGAASDHLGFVSDVIRVFRRLSSIGEAEARRAYREAVLPAASREIGLSPELLAELDALSVIHPAASVWRILRATARRSRGRGTGFLHAGARQVHQIMSAHGAAVPVYAFGHTHVAERWQLSTNPEAWYVNPGAWATDLGGRTFAVVEVDDDAQVTSRLMVWDAQARRAVAAGS